MSGRMLDRILGVVTLVLASTVPASALADTGSELVARAQDELDRLDFEEARRTLARAEHLGDSAPDELAEIYRLSGIVAGAYGDEDAAEGYFIRWLAIRPDAKLGDGHAPRIAEPFARARSQVAAGSPLRVAPRAGGGGEGVELVVEADDLALVAGAIARFDTAGGIERTVRATGDSPYELAVPHDADGAIAIAALDRHGNRLVEVTWTPSPAREAAPDATAPTIEETSSGRALYAQWYVWGGAATGLAAASAYFALQAQRDQRELDRVIRESEEHEYAEARAVESRGRRNARWANAAGVAAAATGVTAVVLLITQVGSDSGSERSGARALVTPLRGGGAAAVKLRF